MVKTDPSAPREHWASPFDLEAHWRKMEETEQARKPKLPPLELTPYGPDRNVIWTTYYAFLDGGKFPLPNGHWPPRALYDPTFIGPLPPNNRWWIPPTKRDNRTGLWYFTNNMVIPDPNEVAEWIKQNAVQSIHIYYSWEEKGVMKSRQSHKKWTYRPNDDCDENRRFRNRIREFFGWLETERVFLVGFDFDDENDGGKFKLRFPWRYKEQ
ncbi:hypothetical protein [Sphingobium bisphenolivorans]|uniref:hypothetical protein n=1 Tax=Sphingobium bisphenolivorans TaxID=1335760 RepID=UPI00126A4A93|nr:hypothetical protein [Sphingobium bisphenolivorans]